MTSVWQSIRNGAWLTPQRARAYSLIVLILAATAFLGWIALSDGWIDRNGKPIGTDFSNVYAAGTLLWQGKAGDAYDPQLQHHAEKVVFGGRDVPFYGWHYPPFFFAVAAIVASLPYAWGLLLLMASSLAAYLAVIRAIIPKSLTLLVAAAFPAVAVNIGHGQNGFLTAGLLGGALHLIERRPAVAGILIGLLAYKPQFGALIPLALLAGGRWTTLFTAAATVATLVVVSVATLGTGIWHAFADSATFTQTVVLEQGNTGWEKIQSIFSALRMWGAGIPSAYAAQIALAGGLAVSLMWLWRSDADLELKAAGLSVASLLATPYVLDYDLVVLAVAIAFLARHGIRRGFGRFEISLLALAWLMPLLTRSVAAATGLPLGLLVLLVLYAAIITRARGSLTAPTWRLAQA